MMLPISDEPLYLDVTGPGWEARLEVSPPKDPVPRDAPFSVPWTGQAHTREILAEVRYSTAINLNEDSWPNWHVKVYQCATDADCDALRGFLRKQAIDIRAANASLNRPGRFPVEPPWAMVPVEIVRGDGRRENYDGTHTVLGASPLSHGHQQYPAWFAADIRQARRTIVAVSPAIQPIDWPKLSPSPATEHLGAFEAMAVGLDVLHSKGVAHCDIKPANVCQYWGDQRYGYVLIDADAATRITPEPVSLRWTPPYEHPGIVDWNAQARLAHSEGRTVMAINSNVLLAHDRFCFVLVVLSALAGVAWVRGYLLEPDDPDDPLSKPAYRYDDVRARLRGTWEPRDKRDEDLVDALAEPFRPGVLQDNWSAAGWLRRIRRATGNELTQDETDLVARYRADLDGLREEIRLGRYGARQLSHTVDLIHQRAAKLAWREASRWLYGLPLTLITLGLVVSGIIFWKGK